MRKAVRVTAAVALLVVSLSSNTTLGASNDSRYVSVFTRLLHWVTGSRVSSPAVRTPRSNSRLSPPIGSPDPGGRSSASDGSTDSAPATAATK